MRPASGFGSSHGSHLVHGLMVFTRLIPLAANGNDCGDGNGDADKGDDNNDDDDDDNRGHAEHESTCF